MIRDNFMAEKITISLSKKQRDLLLKYEPYFADIELFKMLSIAVKKGSTYEICLTEEKVEELLDQVAELSNSEENETMQDRLDVLADHLSSYYDGFDGIDDYSRYSENTGAVYALKVALEGDLRIWRKIAIRAGQTLHDLHSIIFDAFDREDDHLYSFYIPTRPLKTRPRRIHDAAVEYTHPFNYEERCNDTDKLLDASTSSIGSLNLKEGQKLYYLFDFGDSWWHEITVEKTDGLPDEGKCPRITERKGKSPEQYAYPEDEEDENYE
jgi:hypothetical protein